MKIFYETLKNLLLNVISLMFKKHYNLETLTSFFLAFKAVILKSLKCRLLRPYKEAFIFLNLERQNDLTK